MGGVVASWRLRNYGTKIGSGSAKSEVTLDEFLQPLSLIRSLWLEPYCTREPEKAPFLTSRRTLSLWPMETHAFGFRLRANAPKGQKRFPISRMKKMPPITFLSVLAILFFGFESCPAQAEEPGLLDGMKFEGSLTEDGSKAAPFEETLIFENGEFLSKACIPYGFGKAPYKATREGDRIKWSAVVPNLPSASSFPPTTSFRPIGILRSSM